MEESIVKRKNVSITKVLESKGQKKLTMVTCYDSSFAKLISRTDIDMVLVGDSVGNVCMGYSSTIKVTLDDMVHYSACVARGLKGPLLVTDMPFMSYKVSCEQALESAAILIQQGGANAVKLEGGEEICDKVKCIVDAGIPVMGHLGFTPQSVNAFGGIKVQARDSSAIHKIRQDALALQKAGVFAIVLELIPAHIAQELTEILSVPTIGIGAGVNCDGQVLVLHDLLGINDDFKPKFLKKYASVASITVDALNKYSEEVKEGIFPDESTSYT